MPMHSSSENPPVPDAFIRDLHRINIQLPDAAPAQLAAYVQLFLQTNQQFNLSATKTADEFWPRHVLDSLTVLPGLADLHDGAAVIDVGSGGGLPGLPLAVALPRLRFTLLEATGKKARFIEQAVAALQLTNVAVLNDRAETAGQDRRRRQNYDAAVTRAVGPMNVLLELTLPLLRVGGRLLAMKGPSLEQELAQCAEALDVLGGGEVTVVDAYPEGFGVDTVIAIIEKARPTPRDYPRLPGIPKQSPLR
jgi:16S rRNA (guanine527-N7)-methyltransferase